MTEALDIRYIIAIGIAILPIAGLFLYIYDQDKEKPEPMPWLWKGVALGVLSSIIVFAFTVLRIRMGFPNSFFTQNYWGILTKAFMIVSLPEEAAKLLMLYLLLKRNPYFDEHLDGIVYACCIGLGFAGVENICYLIHDMEHLAQHAFMRSLFAVPGHFLFAVTMGFFVSMGTFCSKTRTSRNLYFTLALIIPFVLHGIFDSLLMTRHIDSKLASICWLIFIAFSLFLHYRGQKHIQYMKKRDNLTTS